MGNLIFLQLKNNLSLKSNLSKPEQLQNLSAVNLTDCGIADAGPPAILNGVTKDEKNNQIAKKTAEYLQSIPLPDHTEYIESISGAGKFVGNGNGMQYLGYMLIKSELDIEELKKYYSSYALNEWDALVEEQRGQDIEFIENGSLSFSAEMDNGKYYIVYSWGSGSGMGLYSEFDIRGH